jgi:hypothetical protein
MQLPFLILKLKGRVFITAFFVDPEKQKSRGALKRSSTALSLWQRISGGRTSPGSTTTNNCRSLSF